MKNNEKVLDCQGKEKRRFTCKAVTKFRFILEGTNLTSDYVKSVDIDFINKNLKIKFYEIYTQDNEDIPSLEWIEKFEDDPDKEFSLTTIDGYGNNLFKYVFYGPILKQRTESFDYADSEAATFTAVFSFYSVKRIKL